MRAICFWGQGGCCVPSLPMKPLRLEQTDPELISAQQRVMERGLSVFCQAFDGVIDCERLSGMRSLDSNGREGRTKNTHPLLKYKVPRITSTLWPNLNTATDGCRWAENLLDYLT